MCVEMSLLIYTPFNIHQEKGNEKCKNAQQKKGSEFQILPSYYITTYGKGSGNTSFKFVF
jgi:hypothetical protein